MRIIIVRIIIAIFALTTAVALADDADLDANNVEAAAALAPKCSVPYQKDEDDCWLQVTGRAHCYVWNNAQYDHHQVTSFAGECRDGRLNGEGVQITQTSAYRQISLWTNRGDYTRGMRSGRWTLRQGNGGTHRGHYRNGERHGRWVYRAADGWERARCYRHGKRVEC